MCVSSFEKRDDRFVNAVKRVDKRKLNTDDIAALRTEVDIMLKLNHPNIVGHTKRSSQNIISILSWSSVPEVNFSSVLHERIIQRSSKDCDQSDM